MQNKQTNPQKLRIFNNVITVFFLPVGSYIFHGLLYSQKKLLWPWIFHSGSSRSLWGPTLKYIFPFHPFTSPVPGSQIVGKARKYGRCERGGAKEKGGRKGARGGKKGKRKFPPGFFSCLHFLNSTDPTISEPGTMWNMRQQSGNSCPRKTGIQWIVLHDAAPAFPISCPVHCTAKLAELEGSEALGVRVKKGRIYGTVYFCQSNKVGKLHISRFSINRREKLDLEFWYQSWNRRTLGISLGHGTCCAWLVVWYDFCSCWILTPWMPTYGSNNLPSYQ